jgi:hypothetical protein
MLIEQFKQQRLKSKTLHKRDRSPATVNRELQVLSKVFSMAYDNGLVETNPMRRMHKLREAPARERYLTNEERKDSSHLSWVDALTSARSSSWLCKLECVKEKSWA